MKLTGKGERNPNDLQQNLQMSTTRMNSSHRHSKKLFIIQDMENDEEDRF